MTADRSHTPTVLIPMCRGAIAMRCLLKTLIAGEEGATMVEYALMIALIGAALVTVIGTLSSAVSTQFSSMATDLSGAAS